MINPSCLIYQHTVDLVRSFFQSRHYQEITVPTILPFLPLEPNLYPLTTNWNYKNIPFYLITSPESSLKKLISQGLGDCFTFAKVFRDLENIGPNHNLEFTMLEWYQINKNYLDVLETTQELILDCYHGYLEKQSKRITNILTYQGQSIDLSLPWPQDTLNNLFKKFANFDLSQNLNTDSLLQTAKTKGYNIDNITTWEPLYTQIFINEIEPNLPKDSPFIILDYPAQLSPLCSPCPAMAGFNQRFEFYIGGMEIGNAYTESNDSNTIKKHFGAENKLRCQLNLPNHPYDQDFINKCSQLPPCAGIGLGIDRLAMLLANTANIEDVLFFPTSKLIQSK